MASKRFITKAQAAYSKAVAERDEWDRLIVNGDSYWSDEYMVEQRNEAEAEAGRILSWLQLALAGESNRTAEQISGWSPARRDVGRSTAAMVQEVAR